MEIYGYSERGMLNSLFYEIAYSQNDLQLLNELLRLVCFPYKTIDFEVSEAKLLIEQSFSDFGDADAVLLLNNRGDKQVVFIEAKVKTYQRRGWSISKEFEKFKEGVAKGGLGSSNLFVQLYHKIRMIRALRDNENGIEELKKGVLFPRESSKRIRKIGSNGVVLEAVKMLKSYCKNDLYVAILPESMPLLERFYRNTLESYRPGGFRDWDVENWGFISWECIEKFCKGYNLKNTIKNFEFNEGQIYDKSQSKSR